MSIPPALVLQSLSHRMGETQILRQIDLEVMAGEKLALIGPNGAGKTTLFNLISGRQVPTEGNILLQGQSVIGLSPDKLRCRGLSRSFQITHLFPTLSVLDNLRCALMRSFEIGYCFWRSLERHAELEQRALALLAQLQLNIPLQTPVHQLSYADQRTLELGLALAGDSRVLLLDEPTAGMSLSEARHVTALIQGLTQDRTLLLIEHDMRVVFELADRIVVLVNGQILANDTPQAIRRNPAVQAAYLGQSVSKER